MRSTRTRARRIAVVTRRIAVVVVLAIAACSSAPPKQQSGNSHSGSVVHGYATWYGEAQMTASGERFNKNAMTAAHRTLPLGTRVRVTNERNGRSVVVRINDRGPYGGKGRIIDLSQAAAKQLDMIDAGVVPVSLEVVQ